MYSCLETLYGLFVGGKKTRTCDFMGLMIRNGRLWKELNYAVTSETAKYKRNCG